MLDKILLKIEPLEIDLKNQIKKSQKNHIWLITNIFLKQLLKLIYFKFHRIILKPKLRNYISSIERKFFRKFTFKEEHHLVTKLKEDSYTDIEDLFDKNEISELKLFFCKKRILKSIYTDHKDFMLKEKPNASITGYIKTEELINNSLVIKGANNPKLLSLLDSYFKCTYKLDWVWSWWSFPGEEKLGPQKFHRDYENLNFVKVFVYLTDVDSSNGPHQIIKGSHKIDKFYTRTRFSDNVIFENFNKKEDLISIEGKRGKSFIANTYAIHKGKNPQNEKRLVLVYLFSVVPSKRSPKIPPVMFSELKNYTKKLVLKNRYINSQFIDFNK